MQVINLLRAHGVLAMSEKEAIAAVRGAERAPDGATVTDDDVRAVAALAKRAGVSPMDGTIALYLRDGGRLAPGIALEGWLAIISRHPENDGVSFDYSPDRVAVGGKMVHEWVECTMSRKGRTNPTIVREFLDDCYEAADPAWEMPNRQLRHRALVQCARIALGIDAEDGHAHQAHTPAASAPAPDVAETPDDADPRPSAGQPEAVKGGGGVRRRAKPPAEPAPADAEQEDLMAAASREPQQAGVAAEPAPKSVVRRLQGLLAAFAPHDEQKEEVMRKAGVNVPITLEGITAPDADRVMAVLAA